MDLIDHEAVGDGSVGGEAGAVSPPESASADAGAGEATSSPAEEAAPAWTPQQIEALQADPAFRDYLANESSQIAEARFAALLEQASQQQPTPQGQVAGPGFDANEFLNPYGDNFGQNLLTVMGQMLQGVTAQVGETLSPLMAQREQADAAARDDLLKTTVTKRAGATLQGGDHAVKRVIASVRNEFYPEAARTWGNTDRAAEVAIDNAIRAEREYQAAIGGGTVQQHTERIATLAGVHGEPGAGSGSGVVTIGDKPLSAQERVAKYAAQMRAAHQ